MSTFTAGPFLVEVYDHIPPVMRLERHHPNGSGEVLEQMTIHPEDLADLLHVLQRADAAARRRLGTHARSMD